MFCLLLKQIELQKVKEKDEMFNFDNLIEGMSEQMASLASFHEEDHLQVIHK